jgi:hypothetical protein
VFFVSESSQAIPQLGTCAMKPTSDRSHWNVQKSTNLLISVTVKILENDNCPLFGPKLIKRGLNDRFTFASFERQRRICQRRMVGRAVIRPVSALADEPIEPLMLTLSVTAQGNVDTDPVNPGVERAVAMKLVEPLESPNKRVLQDILSIFMGAHEPQDGRIETILVSANQDTECLGIACAACFYEVMIVVTSGHQGLRRSPARESS